MAHAQNDLRTLTQTLRIPSPVKTDKVHDVQFGVRQPASSPSAPSGGYGQYAPPMPSEGQFNL